MNCTGNCNQGRSCTCAPQQPVTKPNALIEAVIVLLVCILFAGFASLLGARYAWAGRWAATLIAAMSLGFAAGWLLKWLAEKVIDAIDWMTRNET